MENNLSQKVGRASPTNPIGIPDLPDQPFAGVKDGQDVHPTKNMRNHFQYATGILTVDVACSGN